MKQANGTGRGAFDPEKDEGPPDSQREDDEETRAVDAVQASAEGDSREVGRSVEAAAASSEVSSAQEDVVVKGGEEGRADGRGEVPPSVDQGGVDEGHPRSVTTRSGTVEQTLLDWLGHELRNPIAAIELAVTSMRELRDPRLEAPLGILERQSHQLGHVMLQVIEMARQVSQLRDAPLHAPAGSVFRPMPSRPRSFSDADRTGRPRRPSRGTRPILTPSRHARGTGPMRNHHRLLLVEDNPDLSDLLRDMLVSWGFEVNAASTASAALATAQRTPPDVALIDIGLPDQDGCEVARALRDMLPPTVPLFAMSGYGQREDGARALAAGFDEFFVKPLNTGRLRRLLGDVAGMPLVSGPRKL